MLHVEACIKMLDPTYNLARITVKRRKANGWFKRARYIGGRWTCSGQQSSP